GWSETGGPWVPPAEGMKKYVWSETPVEGGKPFSGTLAKPPATTGPFQNIPVVPGLQVAGDTPPPPPGDFYRDSAVVAYRLPDSDVALPDLHPKITTSSGTVDLAVLTDGDFVKFTDLPSAAEVGQKAWILYEFEKPQSIQSVTMAMGGPVDPMGIFFGYGESGRDLEASDDGQQFRKVVHIENGAVGTTTAFA